MKRLLSVSVLAATCMGDTRRLRRHNAIVRGAQSTRLDSLVRGWAEST